MLGREAQAVGSSSSAPTENEVEFGEREDDPLEELGLLELPAASNHTMLVHEGVRRSRRLV